VKLGPVIIVLLIVGAVGFAVYKYWTTVRGWLGLGPSASDLVQFQQSQFQPKMPQSARRTRRNENSAAQLQMVQDQLDLA